MKTMLYNLMIQNWPRKCIAVILAVVIWLVVDQTLTTTKTVSNIPIRVVNIPDGKTIEGLQSNNFLNRKVTLTLTGKKTVLEELSSNDLEVIIDAQDRPDEWVSTITKRNLSPLNPEINVSQDISKVSSKSFIIKLSKLTSEKIPVFISQPIGESPKGYHFLDVWPYRIYLTVSGPEEVVKKLKQKGLKLTFNLNDISKAELDNLQTNTTRMPSDVVSFFVPNQWKQVYLPSLSNAPVAIDDPDSKFLRIDFVRSELLPLGLELPVSYFLSPHHRSNLNPGQLKISTNQLVKTMNGLPTLSMQLYAKGVSELFIEIVKEMLEVVLLFPYKGDVSKMDWSVQFINPKVLEDRYVSTLMSDTSNQEFRYLQPSLRQEYLRNRFRNYMNRFQLFKADDKLLELQVQLKGNQIVVSEPTPQS
ncbi:MAG: hypothetical protein MRY21_07195 [Simkaniaceae bacterium]|nr:hypothetical protein [Simkaniaceae bacterium]